jgi:hypothetical protein
MIGVAEHPRDFNQPRLLALEKLPHPPRDLREVGDDFLRLGGGEEVVAAPNRNGEQRQPRDLGVGGGG